MSTANRLSGLSAVVTGATRGIGRAIALRYAAEGARVVCAGRNQQALASSVTAITSNGGSAVAVHVDVTDEESVQAFAQTTRELIDGPDILVNNAGIIRVGRFMDLEMDAWTDVFDVNIFGPVRVTKSLLPAMLERRAGSIVNIASTAGKYGTANQTPYNASKHALVGFTRSLALEVASAGVRVNAICPGFVDTDVIENNLDDLATVFGVPRHEVLPALLSRVPIGRLLESDEIAELALYLAESRSGGMTGQAITLAGGLILI